MSGLVVCVVSIAPTRRRRFLWAAWWTGAPCRDPFRKPDAYHGGARTRAEALAAAERAAGVTLSEVEPRWARAWANVLVGLPPWRVSNKGEAAGTRARREGDSGASAEAASGSAVHPRASIWSILGVSSDATDPELKRAFRKRALETHPDRGGDAAAFRDLTRAYEEARRRNARPKRRRG